MPWPLQMELTLTKMITLCMVERVASQQLAHWCCLKILMARNFEEWISHFESIAAINKWNEEKGSVDPRSIKLTWHSCDSQVILLGRMMLSREHCKSVLSLLVSKKYIKQNSRIEENKKTESWGDFRDELL